MKNKRELDAIWEAIEAVIRHIHYAPDNAQKLYEEVLNLQLNARAPRAKRPNTIT